MTIDQIIDTQITDQDHVFFIEQPMELADLIDKKAKLNHEEFELLTSLVSAAPHELNDQIKIIARLVIAQRDLRLMSAQD